MINLWSLTSPPLEFPIIYSSQVFSIIFCQISFKFKHILCIWINYRDKLHYSIKVKAYSSTFPSLGFHLLVGLFLSFILIDVLYYYALPPYSGYARQFRNLWYSWDNSLVIEVVDIDVLLSVQVFAASAQSHCSLCSNWFWCTLCVGLSITWKCKTHSHI